MRDNKYIYCVIHSEHERNFGPIGLGGRNNEVLTIGYDDLSMVVSNYPMTKLVVDRKSLLAHEKVIERVMQEYDSVIPMRFGTLASSVSEIRDLLYSKYREFKDYLRSMAYKMELGVKGIWKDMPAVYDEILKENKEIKRAKERFLKSKGQGIDSKIAIGKMVEQALSKKKTKEAENIAEVLNATAVNYKFNKVYSNEMFMNAAFLVNKDREEEFDKKMDRLNSKYKDRIKFKYVGPLPVFNFVDIAMGNKNLKHEGGHE